MNIYACIYMYIFICIQTLHMSTSPEVRGVEMHRHSLSRNRDDNVKLERILIIEEIITFILKNKY